MTRVDSGASIASYEEYLMTYFPIRSSSPLSLANSPKEMGIQLAVESLEKHSESLYRAVAAKQSAEQCG